MSKIALSGDASGTGTFTIASPNSNSNYTLTLPTTTGTIALTSDVSSFPSGTVMLFGQTSAPTGWTKDTTNYNNSALRIVTGSASTGGTVDFTTAFVSQTPSGTVGSTTLTTAQIPSHTHSTPRGTVSGGSQAQSQQCGSDQFSTTSGAAGGGGSHNHTFTGTAINLAVKYVDVIRATKD
jgi:hypothetical protein